MNIKFGMDNFYVRYLKRFLANELSQTNRVLGPFDKTDLSSLIKYLNLPNVQNMFVVRDKIQEQFPQLDEFFTMLLKDNVIQWTSRAITTEASSFITTNLESIEEFCNSMGWEIDSVVEWIDLSKDINEDGNVDDLDRQILQNIVYNHHTYPTNIMERADLNVDGTVNEDDITILDEYLNNNKLMISIKMSNRHNYFPNKDMLVFINQFEGEFMYNYAFRSETGTTDMIEPTTGNYKVALYKCKPGQKVTIAHNSSDTCHIAIGCSQANLKQDLTAFMLLNVVEIDLGPGESYQYTCTSEDEGTGYDANWLCIQVPADYSNLENMTEKTTILNVGDVNQDGQIDMQDYTMLAQYTAEGPSAETYPYNKANWTPTKIQAAVMDINKDGVIDNKDAVILYRFVSGDPAYPSLGTTPYTTEVEGEFGLINNVQNLLIIDGHYADDVNIPFNEFTENDWIIHEKFFNYLLGMSIHKYSNSNDITYLQKLMKEYYPQYTYQKDFFYPGVYSDNMKQLIKDFQKSQISYTLGDLNRDNRLTNEDLVLMRELINALNDIDLVEKYLIQEAELTEEQLEEFDLNDDGKVDKEDLDLMNEQLEEKYSLVLRVRADVNRDGLINKTDYEILQKQIEGKTDQLTNYDITFMLGWYDVPTENLFEETVNFSGNISEVSK